MNKLRVFYAGIYLFNVGDIVIAESEEEAITLLVEKYEDTRRNEWEIRELDCTKSKVIDINEIRQ